MSIRDLRRQHGISQVELAKRLGRHRSWVIRLEANEANRPAGDVLGAEAALQRIIAEKAEVAA